MGNNAEAPAREKYDTHAIGGASHIAPRNDPTGCPDRRLRLAKEGQLPGAAIVERIHLERRFDPTSPNRMLVDRVEQDHRMSHDSASGDSWHAAAHRATFLFYEPVDAE